MSGAPIFRGHRADEVLFDATGSTSSSAVHTPANSNLDDSVLFANEWEWRPTKLSGPCGTRGKASLRPEWPIFVFSASVLMVALLCRELVTKGKGVEAHSRRLAERGRSDDEELSGTKSADFAGFCESIGAGDGSPSLSAAPRASPSWIGDFLSDLEGGKEWGNAAVIAPDEECAPHTAAQGSESNSSNEGISAHEGSSGTSELLMPSSFGGQAPIQTSSSGSHQTTELIAGFLKGPEGDREDSGLRAFFASEDSLEYADPAWSWSFGGWSPVQSSSPGPRKSPDMIAAFFREADGENQGIAAAVGIPSAVNIPHWYKGDGNSPSTSKRQAFDAGSAEQQSSRPKVPRTESLVTGVQFVDNKPSAPSEPTGSVPLQPELGTPWSRHPFLRLPVLLPGVSPRLFDPTKVRNQTVVNLEPLLVKIRELLLRLTLGQKEADELVQNAELLASHAYRSMALPISTKDPYYTIGPLGRRFMVFNALHSVKQVIGSSMQSEKWWGDISRRVVDLCEHWMRESQFRSQRNTRKFLAEMSKAIRGYKCGNVPSPADVLSIKLNLFSNGGRGREFKKPSWAPWRADADWKAEGRK